MPHTRPTTDIAKEGLFNTLQHQLDFTSVKSLDLFGGTGCISYELASRGVEDLTIVEKDPKMFAFIEKTAKELGITQMKTVRSEVFRFIENCRESFDFIFAGPPYAMETIDELPRKIIAHNLLNPGGRFVLEHTPRNHYETFPFFKSARNYGTTIFSTFIFDKDADTGKDIDTDTANH
jgi:16S rRNA (guanine(966)-N(2))-methyltransferase RsmD